MDGERDFLKESVLSLSFPDSHAPTISATVGLDMCTEQANGAESIWPIFVERQRQMTFLGMKVWPGGKKDWLCSFGCMNARDSGA